MTGEGTPVNQRTGAEAGVEVEDLTQCDVQRPDAAADGRGQRALDTDVVGLEGFEGFPRGASCRLR